ncbi:hypothetical protein CC86DRAFT_92902 [Ophiobolus disseminans]|uniref:Cytochrome P450 n=1 Tax=Ophiobolus disseminans TaxID=1469910 RepID=A0A6A7AJB4_9PLEO|nr:hypothetical protein CC86DRAFT_92902 [Ophiobolus disseminans]
MKPNARKSRDNCIEAMKLWRQHAVEHMDSSVKDDAAWDPEWGLGAIKRRNKLVDATEGLFEEEGRASIDLALIWSLNSNVIPASFWYLTEVLASKDIFERIQNEIEHECGPGIASSGEMLDPVRQINNALLQAVYAETLRLHVATLITRTVKKGQTVRSWLL